MRRAFLSTGLLRAGVVAAVCGSMLAATAASAQELNRELRKELDRAKLGTSKVGISVVDSATGASIGKLRDNAPTGTMFMPASNMKLLTSGTAVLVLGKDFEFRTRVYKAGSRLIIEGAGDPALGDGELLGKTQQGVNDFVDRIVQAVLDAKKADGTPLAATFTEVVADDRIFDREYVHPSWPSDQRFEWYCAEVSGLNFNTNVLRLWATPGRDERDTPTLRWEPSGGGVEVENRTRTVRKADTTSLSLIRDADSNRFTARGSIRATLEEPVRVTMHESGEVLARMIAEQLSRAGRGEGGASVRGRLATADDNLGAAEQVLVVVRTPLSTVLERCNGDSHNLYADCLLKRSGNAVTGQPGSWANGAAVVRMQIRERVGPEAAASISVADGSGLSRGNLITPEIMTGWLSSLARDARSNDVFATSLPLAAAEGNMVKRFKGKTLANEVRCKSGYINGVRTLSGYVTQRGTGRRIAFSILVNDIPANVSGAKVKEFQEDVVAMIDGWLGAAAAGAGAGAGEKEAVGG